jgi:hypothetical protein
MSKTRFWIAAAILLSAPAIAQVANAPCFETNLGTNLNLSDDQVSGPQALGFTFPGPSGPVTSIWVSSNGFIWLAANTDSRCCSGDEQWFLSDPASIAGMWMDFYPPGGTGVYFNAIPASGSAPARGVVTWNAVPEYGAALTAPPETVQVQLLSTGEIVISQNITNNIDGNTGHTALIGVTQGNNATANPIDFLSLTSNPVNTGTNPTAYEVFGPSSYDVAGRSFEFLPNGVGGYLILERTGCRQADTLRYGTGCPRNGTVYEAFNNVDLANSRVVAGTTATRACCPVSATTRSTRASRSASRSRSKGPRSPPSISPRTAICGAPPIRARSTTRRSPTTCRVTGASRRSGATSTSRGAVRCTGT